jgi:hypothetical protein
MLRDKEMIGRQIRFLESEINRLRMEKDEREAALPAHTVRPHQIMAIEALEDEIALKEAELAELMNSPA